MNRPKEFEYWDITPSKPEPKPKISKHKAKLDGKHLIVKTWKAANDGTVFSLNYDGKDLEVWEFGKVIFPDLSDLSRSSLNLFSPWFLNVFTPSKNKFRSTFNVEHWNVAKHIVERIAIVREVLKNESR